MATLEKIRKKSVLLFIVIIGALLAFILGDFISSGRSFTGPGDTVAKAKGAKVDYKTYQERVNLVSDQAKNDPRMAGMDQQVLEQMVIEELLMDALLEQEYENLGINVTDAQISKLFFDEQYKNTTFQALLSEFGQEGAMGLYQAGITSTQAYNDAMKNPAKYKLSAEEGQLLTNVWAKLEKEADKSLRQSAYFSLISGLFTANEVDAKALYNDRNTTNTFAYVKKDFTTVPDDQVKLTDDDYQKYYDEHKGLFKLTEETRAVKYIVVPVQPSAADYEAASKDAGALRDELLTSEGTPTALQNHKKFSSKAGKYTNKDLAMNPSMRVFTVLGDTTAAPVAVGMVKDLPTNPGTYAIAKVTGQTTGIDKVKFSAFGAEASADSLFENLTLASFDSIATKNQGQTGIELSLVNPTMNLVPKVMDALASNPVGEVFFITDTVQAPSAEGNATPQPTVYKTAMLITERDLPVDVYEITTMEYTVVPSAKTKTDLNSKLHAYVAHNNTTESFAANAQKNGYTVVDATVSPSTPGVGNAPASRNIVKWAMENDKGKVSNVFDQSSHDYLMAIAVDDIFDGDYAPVTAAQVREQIKPYLMAEKKAQKLIDQYNGKASDINGYASLMGEPAATAEAVFGENNIAAIGMNELAVQGKVAGTAKGKIAGPFKGQNAIYVISVSDSKTAGRPYDFKEDARNFMQYAGSALYGAPESVLRLLLGNAKVTNNILEFTAGE